ncbi:cob(I)yrinic acid a,c-diamide adenosyltransferase [Halodesulfovibrio aestuarii]|uniref:corrinoid adenosyltransferase n=1 Tax=Halodesulfovibrio aestuarii TaxID=126333 RepID=A0A8G2C7C8_9BACT|nr:cob(I)yrinic acid a,c-diamide adenosyltransferase [Halodesulfovibrio aestuarii]SHI61692.1 cob(I)alamin adenosyltransferase [Halodesulfovibrio aestuarii]
MILVNTGNGKGKTTASVGQAIRALGQEHTVAFGQFMKRDSQAGEQYMLHKLLGNLFFAPGDGFLTKPEQFAKHRATSEKLIWWAKERILDVDMLILDEVLYALSAKLITREELEEIIALARNNDTHLVLSGRNAPKWLIDEADLVTEMTEIKHHYKAGIPAQKGIEF